MSRKRTIVIADTEEQFCNELASALQVSGDYEVLGIAHDGEEAIQLVKEQKPDLLVIDLLLPQYDGLSVLDMISVANSKPTVFVVTGFISSYIISALNARKISCLLRKPCPAEYVAKRISDALRRNDAPIEEKLPNIKHQITAMIHAIGVPADIKGYHYLRDAIKIAAEDMDRINSMTECIYKPVALLNNTTAERVQRAILRAIEIAWDRGDLDTLQQFFGYTVSNTKGRPTNSEFIALLADKIQLSLPI